MPIKISIRADTRALERQLTKLARTQVPFAIALAINAVAKRVVQGETEALSQVFDAPRAFTKSAFTQAPSFGGAYATKRSPTAIITAKPLQAAYLAPSEDGTPQSLGQGKKIRTPVNVRTSAGGNIPKDELRRLFAEPDVFLGEVRGVNGIWQRPSPPRPKGAPKRRLKSNTTGRLKLLVAFTRPVQVKTKLGYRERAEMIVQKHFNTDFDAAIAKALASAR